MISEKGFFIGDPKYFLSKKMYENLNNKNNNFIIFKTIGQDGYLYDDDGYSYDIHYNMVGIFPLELVDSNNFIPEVGRVINEKILSFEKKSNTVQIKNNTFEMTLDLIIQ